MVMSNYSNPVLALMSTDSEDDFIRDVVEAYFANPVHVRKILTEDCIESCLDAYMNAQTVELDLSDLPENQDGFTKPSRKNRHKHDKKEYKRKGNAKRFRDRSRKCAHEGHMWKVYHRGMVGDWGRRGRALEETGNVAVRNSYRIVRDIEVDPEVQSEEETRTFTYEDGFTFSLCMSKNAWEKEEEDDFSPNFNWNRKYEWNQWKTHNDEEDKEWLDWEDEWDNDDDEIIDEPEPKKQPSQSQYDTSEFTAIELAQMSMKLACANPDQRALIREFMKTL